MKYLFFCITFVVLNSDKYLTVDCVQNKLKIDIEKIYKHQIDHTNTGYQDLFTIMNPDSSVKYLINIIRAKSPITNYEFLKSEEYKNGFSDSKSKIEEVKEIDYSSFKGVRFFKRIVSSQMVFLSYSISTIIEGDLVVITYNTIDRNFYNYEDEFTYSVNSIKFK